MTSTIVISRLRGESIRIGDNIEVTVIEVRGDKVRLGIVAPSTSNEPTKRNDVEEPNFLADQDTP